MDRIPVSSSNGGGGGNSWPPALRRRLGLPSITSCSSKSKSSYDELSADDVDMLPTAQSSSPTHTTSTLSSHELRQYIHKTYSTLTSIQCQLHRGEESYFEQSYSHGNLLQGWDNIWIEQYHNNHNSNSYTNSGGGVYSSSGMGDDGSSSNSVNNHAHHMNNNKSIPIRKMPAEYRWFTSSCGINLPLTSNDNNNGNIGSGSIGRVAALERWSLIDRPPTPEVQEEKQVANEVDVDNSLKEEADMTATSIIVDNEIKKDISSMSNNNDNTAQSTEDTVAAKVESNVASTTANKSQANGKVADAAAEQTVGVDLMHQSKTLVVDEVDNQFNKGQTSKVVDTEPRSHHTLSSAGQSSTDAEMVIEKKTASSTLEFTTRKDETNDTTISDASSSSNIQPSSSDAISSFSPTAAAANYKDQMNTATVQSNKQTETTALNGDNSTDNNVSSTMMDHPKNSIANKDSSEMTGHTIDGIGTAQEQGSSTSVSLPQSKRARLDINQLPKDDDSTADDDTASSNANMNANLSKELAKDHETNIKVQQLEPIVEEEKVETVPTSSTSVTGESRTSLSRRSTRKRKTTS